MMYVCRTVGSDTNALLATIAESQSILGQRTLSEGTILRCGSSSATHHIGTYPKRSCTTSADWLHTTLCSSMQRGNSKPGCRAGQSSQIPVRLVGHDCRISNFLPSRFCIRGQKCSSPTTVVFWNEAGLVGGQTHRCGLASLDGVSL